jgi:Skp family chaperone for outer membrane proteins
MKTIKFLSFLMLMSLAWIGCEDRTKVNVTAENTEDTLDDAYKSSKTELEKTVNELEADIDAKIKAAEADLEAASDEAKADINIRIDGLRKQRTDLERLGDRIAAATAEGWSDLERESAQVIADIKAAINN